MSNAYFYVPRPVNRSILSYAPGSAEKHCKPELTRLQSRTGRRATGHRRQRCGDQQFGRNARPTITVFTSAVTRRRVKLKSRRPSTRRWLHGKRGLICRGSIASASSCAPPNCWPGHGGRRSTRRRCWGNRRPLIRRKLIPRAGGRFLALQRVLHVANYGGSTDFGRWCLESRRIPGVGRVHLCRDAV